MPRLKSELLDSIVRAGDVGITTHELHVMHYGSSPRTKSSVIKSHICQINDLLEETQWKIRSEGRARNVRWYVTRRRI